MTISMSSVHYVWHLKHLFHGVGISRLPDVAPPTYNPRQVLSHAFTFCLFPPVAFVTNARC